VEFFVKKYQELTTTELYEILQIRTKIFVVEQDCVYQDIDGKDEKALHVFGIKNNKIVAYTRVFKKGDYYKEGASLGRVLVVASERTHGYGHQLLQLSIQVIQQEFNTQKIVISAQKYLLAFYESHGFIKQGYEYLEDGIPHFEMVKN